MEESKPLVSIIMPVYNSEKYLAHAIDTVLNQDYESFELILVDDGSKDKSGVICDGYRDKDPRVKVLHKENGGICSARNAGIDMAKGKYIGFCDDDGEFLPGLISDNVRLIEKTCSDMVRFLREHVIYSENSTLLRSYVITPDEGPEVFDETNFAENYFSICKLSGGVWTGLYRKSFLDENEIRFDERLKFGYEDTLFNFRVLGSTMRVAINPNVYYRWIQREAQSNSRKISMNRFFAIKELIQMEDLISDKFNFREKCGLRWAEHLIDTHIHELMLLLTDKNCELSYKEKIKILDEFSELPAFKKLWGITTIIAEHMKTKTGITYRLFVEKHHHLLLILYTVNRKLTKRN